MPRDGNTSANCLHYATGSDRRRLRRRRIVVTTMWITLSLVAVGAIVHGYAWRGYMQSCANCGAIEHVNETAWYGFLLQRGVRSVQPAVSALIQEQQGHACTHQWEYASGNFGGALGRVCALGRGRNRVSMVRFYEQFANLREVLIAWNDKAPGVFDKFQTLIQKGSNKNPEMQQFEEDLWERLAP